MRPEGWKNPHKLGKGILGITDPCCVRVLRENSYEAGADAYEEALKKSGVYTYGNHTPDIDLDGAPEESGYWCFIPQEVE